MSDIETDVRCIDLAKHFLSGGTALLGEPQDCFENQVSLARAIQQAVEDWFSSSACPREGCPYVGGVDFNIGNPCRCSER